MSYFTEFERVVSSRALWVVLLVVSVSPLLSQDCIKGKFEFKDKEVLLLRYDTAFCSSAMRVHQTLTPPKKSSSFLILPLPSFNQYVCHFCVVQVWFAWTVLNMEAIFEEDSQLRRVVEGELVINALTPDQALKVRELVIPFY